MWLFYTGRKKDLKSNYKVVHLSKAETATLLKLNSFTVNFQPFRQKVQKNVL